MNIIDALAYGVRANGQNTGLQLQDAINDCANMGGGVVRIKKNPYDLSGFVFDGSLIFQPGVELEGVGVGGVDVGRITTEPNWVTLNKNNKITGINFDADGFASSSIVRCLAGWENCTIENVGFANGTKKFSTMDAVVFEGGGVKGRVASCDMDRVYRGVLLVDGGDDVVIDDCEYSNAQDAGNFIFYAQTNVLKITNNRINPFLTDVAGSHAIHDRSATQIATPSTNVTIAGNRIKGNVGVPSYLDGGGDLVKNGATGDIIVLRNSQHSKVDNNHLSDGGELGIDIVGASRNVYVTKNTIERIDGTGIIVGSSLPGQAETRDVFVQGNKTIQTGLDQESLITGTQVIGNHSLSGIRLWNCRRVVVTDNDMYLPGKYAIYVHANSNEATDVRDVAFARNSHHDVGSGSIAFFAGYNPTVSTEQPDDNWTTLSGYEFSSDPAVSTIASDAGTKLTLSGGEITITNTDDPIVYYVLDTEANAATDTLTKINSGKQGQVAVFRTFTNIRTIDVADNASLRLDADTIMSLGTQWSKITMICDSPGVWHELSRSSN